METVKPMVSGIPLVIFSKSSCCSSYSIKTIFTNFGAKIVVHELDQISGGWKIEQALSELGCSPNVPAVFIGGELVGGVNEVNSLHLQQKLIPKLKKAGVIWL